MIKAHATGLARDNPSRIAVIGNEDIQALCDFLGDKKYLMGETMTKVNLSYMIFRS